MKKYVSIICLILFCKTFLYSQVFEYNREIYPTPSASTFIKHNFSEANMYRGAPSISIPIYKIELQDFELPINLNYSYDGLKVGEVASRVGLGWNLNAGGMITHIVKGKPDDGLKGFNYTREYLNIPDPIQDPLAYISWKNSFSNNKDLMRRIATGEIDGIPDEYFMSVGSLSFSFYHIGDNVFVPNPYSAVKIIKNPDGVHDSWKIIDESGNKYYFGSLSNAEAAEMGVDHQSVDALLSNPHYNTAWHIRRIETRFDESIIFNYVSDSRYKENSYVQFELYKNSPSDCPSIPPFNTDITSYTNVWENKLTSITTPKEQISLYATTSRSDLNPYYDFEKRLDSITINDHNDWGKNTHIFEYGFLGGGNYDTRRLILKGIKEFGNSGANPKHYEFNYYDENNSIPSYTEFSIDHWGYFNGHWNANLIPKKIEGSPWNHLFNNALANREPNSAKSKVGLMKSIVLPTGGRVEYEYEPHEYGAITNTNNPPKQIFSEASESISTVKNNPSTEAKKSKRITIGVEQEITLSYDVKSNNYPLTFDGGIVRLRTLFIDHPPIFELMGSDRNGERRLTLQPGTYVIEVDATDVGFSSFISIDYKVPLKDAAGNFIYKINEEAGGHRIKRIVERDSELGVQGIKEFQYVLSDDPDRSSGVLAGFPVYERTELHNKVVTLAGAAFDVPTSMADCQYLVRSGHSDVSINESGSHIGYREVTVKEEGNTDIGVTKYEFTSAASFPDKVFQRNSLSILRSYLRGLLKKRTVLDAFNNPVLVEENLYDIKLDQQFPIGKGTAGVFVCEFDHDDIQDYLDTFKIPFFGIVSSSWVKLISNKVTQYFGNDSISVEDQYFYGNYHHNQISMHERSDSKNGYNGTYLIYPKDYADSGIMNSMRTLNIQNQPIEKLNFVMDENGNKKTSGGIIQSFKVKNNTVLLDEVYRSSQNNIPIGEFKFSNTATIGLDPFMTANQSVFNKLNIDDSYDDAPITKFDTYNLNNRITQFHNHLNYTVAYYWGYNQSYPVVKVENSTSSIVQSAVQLSVPSEFSSAEAMLVSLGRLTTANQRATLKSFNNSIRNNTSLKDAFITTYTYFPTVGMTSQTNTRGETVYFHYDDLNRLEYVNDDEGNILSKNEYNYKN
ncbi:hypothetical protein [Gelidibacter japonicus]|uniref:hypothetical protein n=1 Tax=Gelidibacter japonicus TaxID=1962232 RepID=UPI002AFEAA84|nr:hypothetical protein [Gelidibacter japonicus]